MNREEIIQIILDELELNLNSLIDSTKDASDHASHEDAQAKSKWDTQAIEASYLAAGHAAKAKKLLEDIQSIHGMLADIEDHQEQVFAGSVVKCSINKSVEYFFVSSYGGGLETTFKGLTITVVSPKTPLGQNLIGSKVGDTVLLLNGTKMNVLELLQ
jgi:transcription elongation GreA/GreB family factor